MEISISQKMNLLLTYILLDLPCDSLLDAQLIIAPLKPFLQSLRVVLPMVGIVEAVTTSTVSVDTVQSC